jgi:transposase
MPQTSSERALRAELAELRAVNAELRRGQVLLAEENAALRDRVDRLVELVAELERRLGQNPRNSHKPPSSAGYEKPPPRSRRERIDRPAGG